MAGMLSFCMEVVGDMSAPVAANSTRFHTPFAMAQIIESRGSTPRHQAQMLVMADNHDMDRMFMQLKQDVDLQKMALAYLLTIRGIPQIYYGTEILMDNTPNHKNDGLIRSDFPGGWKDDKVNAFINEGLNANQQSVQNYLKLLLNWRKTNTAITNGKTIHFAPSDGIYVYFRYSKEKTVMVVMNKNDKEMTIEPSRFAEILKGRSMAREVLSNKTVDIQSGIQVNPKSATIFEIK